jgi:hypothetical protein
LKLFLDTSVLLAACGSECGASGYICGHAAINDWTLIVTPYVIDEVCRNLDRVTAATAKIRWLGFAPTLSIRRNVLTLDRPVVFPKSKDRPILFGALAWSDVLLTLDRADFGGFIGSSVYDTPVLTPALFLKLQREAGRLQ